MSKVTVWEGSGTWGSDEPRGPRTIEWSSECMIGGFLDDGAPDMWGMFSGAAAAFGATAPTKIGRCTALTPGAVLAAIGAANRAAIEECGDDAPGPALIDFQSTGVDTWEVRFGSGRTSVRLAHMVDRRNGDGYLKLSVTGPLNVADVPGLVDSVCTRVAATGAQPSELAEIREAVAQHFSVAA